MNAMQIMDYSANICFEDVQELKVIACFSKAIYCADRVISDDIICFTPHSIALGPLSIRVYQWEILFTYMNQLMQTAKHFVMRVNKENFFIDDLSLISSAPQDYRDLKNHTTEVGFLDQSSTKLIKKRLSHWSSNTHFDLEGILSSSITQQIFSTGLGGILPWLLSSGQNLSFLMAKYSEKNQRLDRFISLLARKSIQRSAKIKSNSSAVDLQGKSNIDDRKHELCVPSNTHKERFIGDVINAMHYVQLGLINNEYESVSHGVSELIGFGEGLTPSGDDFLVGLTITLGYSNCHEANELLNTAIKAHWNKTHKISRAFLKTAVEGRTSEPLVVVLANLYQYIKIGSDNKQALRVLMESIIPLFGIGHSSGIDALTGLVFGVLIQTQLERSQPTCNFII